MLKIFYRTLVLLTLVSLAACGNAIPQVDSLTSVTLDKGLKTRPPSSNLSLTQELSGTGFKIKGRVSYVGLQSTLSNGQVQIKGKIVR